MEMNIGEAVSDLVIASQVGALRAPLAGVTRYATAYSPKGLAATVAVNNRLGSDVAAQGLGSALAPFKTIAAAVAAMGKVTTKAGFEQPRTLQIEGGTHDVSSVILPMGRWILSLSGGAKLTGVLRQQLTTAEAFTSTLAPDVAVIGEDTGNINGASFGQLLLVQDPVTPVANANFYARNVNGTDAASIVSGPATVAPQIELDHVFASGLVYPTANLLCRNNCAFTTAISCTLLVDLGGSLFQANITVVTAGTFFTSRFSAAPQTFTGPALSLHLDGDANFSFKVGPWILGGAATKSPISTDLVP